MGRLNSESMRNKNRVQIRQIWARHWVIAELLESTTACQTHCHTEIHASIYTHLYMQPTQSNTEVDGRGVTLHKQNKLQTECRETSLTHTLTLTVLRQVNLAAFIDIHFRSMSVHSSNTVYTVTLTTFLETKSTQTVKVIQSCSIYKHTGSSNIDLSHKWFKQNRKLWPVSLHVHTQLGHTQNPWLLYGNTAFCICRQCKHNNSMPLR